MRELALSFVWKSARMNKITTIITIIIVILNDERKKNGTDISNNLSLIMTTNAPKKCSSSFALVFAIRWQRRRWRRQTAACFSALIMNKSVVREHFCQNIVLSRIKIHMFLFGLFVSICIHIIIHVCVCVGGWEGGVCFYLVGFIRNTHGRRELQTGYESNIETHRKKH